LDEKDEAKAITDAINSIVDKKLEDFKKSLCDEVTAKVATTSPLTVYLRGDTTVAVEVLNPRGEVLSVGDLVRVRFPNLRNDANRFIDRKL